MKRIKLKIRADDLAEMYNITQISYILEYMSQVFPFLDFEMDIRMGKLEYIIVTSKIVVELVK